MELPIEKINGKLYQPVETVESPEDCEGCDLQSSTTTCHEVKCMAFERDDDLYVIYIEVNE